MDMEIALPRNVENPNFSKVTKRLWDANGIPIGRHHNNPILGTRANI